MNNLVTCPHCNHQFDVTGSIQDHIRKEMDVEFQKKLDTSLNEQRRSQEQLEKERKEFEEKKAKQNQIFQDTLNTRLSIERADIKAAAAKENEVVLRSVQDELNEKNKQLQQAKLKDAEIEKLKREKDNLRSDIELENEQKLSSERAKIREDIARQEKESSNFAIREMQKKLDDQAALVEEMKRKAEQGSMQLQGEVQELAIEEWLRTTFPLDQIVEIKKGQRGADCTQVVNTRTRLNCGTIYYESKRTKEFSMGWIEKFKSDMRMNQAGIGVIVTEALPKDMERMGLKDGIWICTFEEFKGLSVVLRDGVVRISEALSTQEGKQDKMGMLYDYMTGPEFRAQIEAVIEAFMSLKEGLAKEQRSIQTQWKEREKQLDKVLTSTTTLIGNIRGIGGAPIGEFKELELEQTL